MRAKAKEGAGNAADADAGGARAETLVLNGPDRLVGCLSGLEILLGFGERGVT